jgi:dihydrolipoamide dehydrogenase
VHLVNERRKRLLPTEDPDLSQFISRGYTSQGVIIHNNCKVLGLDVRAHEVEVRLGTIVARPDGTQDLVPQEPFTVESVLVSVGRIPNTEKLNLKAAGVRVQKNGGIETDKRTCQSIDQPHIYAAGDATLDIGLVSVAEMEGRAAVEHMFNAKVRYRT